MGRSQSSFGRRLEKGIGFDVSGHKMEVDEPHVGSGGEGIFKSNWEDGNIVRRPWPLDWLVDVAHSLSLPLVLCLTAPGGR
jgi:hypothetical protein